MKLDILAFGAHPDDVELGCGGTLLKHKAEGKSIGIIDLTLGQLGTRGTPEIRLKEASAAAKIMGVAVRENLEMEDGFFVNDKAHQQKVIEVIRKYQPEIILINAPDDRHPDHGRAAQLCKEAAFYAGLKKIITTYNNKEQEAWRPKVVYNYIQALYLKPDFVVDISDFQEEKMKAILAHKTQFFNPDSNEKDTFISSKGFLDFVAARSQEFGKITGVKHAEGFIAQRHIRVDNLFNLF